MSTLVDAGLLAKGWLSLLGQLAVHGTVLALAAFALTRAGRLRPSWQAAIWLVVTVKFALPWGPAMPWSLADLVAQLTHSQPEAAPFALAAGMTRVAPAYTAWPAVGWLALGTLWFVGATIVLSRAVVAQRRTSRAARSAEPAPVAAQAVLRALSPTTRLVIGAPDVGPHVVGMLRPIIVVPRSLLDDHALLRAALLHELAHVRRRDALARIVQIAASTLLWWWPVVRIVQKRLELAREAACDAWALEAGDVARPAYARLLVRMASLRTHAHAHALAAHHSLDARVAAVLGPPARARMSHWHRLALAGWVVLALGGARSATARGKADLCTYTPEMAAALYTAFPDADADGDGMLSRDEACDLQAELKDKDEAQIQSVLAEPLKCDEEPIASPEPASCSKAEGVD